MWVQVSINSDQAVRRDCSNTKTTALREQHLENLASATFLADSGSSAFMSKADHEESKSRHDLANLFRQLDKLRQSAIPSAKPLSSPTAESVLQSLLTIEFPTKNVADQKFIDAIVSGSKSLSCQEACFKDFCELICKVFSKQTKPSTLKQSAYISIVTFLLENFNASSDAETKVDILRALSIILYDNIHNNSKNFEELLPLLIQVADKSTRPLEVRRMAINCLGNICCNAGTKLQNYYSAIFEVIMSNISTVEHTSQGTTMIVARSLDFNDQALRRVASSTLRSLHLLLYEDKSILSNKLVDIVDIIRTFVFYNINSTTYKHAKEDGFATTVNSMQLLPHQQRISHLRQQEQTKRLSAGFSSPLNSMANNRDYGAMSSDSEISDSEGINPGSRRHRDNAKIRINALLCLQAIAKTSPKAFYPYWESFIPHNFDPFAYYNKMKGTSETQLDRSLASHLLYVEHAHSLFTILLFDPTPNVRMAVSNVLMGMLDGSKQYLSVAVARDAKSTSFTSLSEKVATIARDLHNGLRCALEIETNPTITVQLFKCFTLLIQNSSYDRLAKGYVPRIYSKLIQYIDNSDHRIVVGALATLYALLDNKSAAEEIRSSIKLPYPSNQPDDHVQLESLGLNADLFKFVQDKIKQRSQGGPETSEPILFALESWNILSACTRTQPLWLPHLWKIAASSFPDILDDEDVTLRCSAIRFIDSYANALNEKPPSELDHQVTLDWWTTVIEQYIQKTTQDSDYQVRALACDCMSVISQETFEAMNPRRQRLCISLLVPLAEDEHPDVRAAACHALGVLVVFPSLREDPMFTSDVALAMLEQMEDKSLFVKVRASWTLANLCDALVLEQQNNPDFDINEILSLELWCKVTAAAAGAANDNDKLKSNGVRALGSVTKIAPLKYLDSVPGRRCIEPIMGAMIKNIETGTLKARWNACHAAGNILRNPNFPIGSNRWTIPFYEALLKSLRQCKNFKVRIHACAALGSSTQRSQYGTEAMYYKVIKSVKDCLKDIDQDLPDISFMEMRYMEQLKEQLETTVSQLEQIS